MALLWRTDSVLLSSENHNVTKQAEPLIQWMIASHLLPPADDLVRLSDGRVYDSRTWKRLFPPVGRNFHPTLARFAPDGRFVTNYPGGLLIDTLTDKQVGTLSGE